MTLVVCTFLIVYTLRQRVQDRAVSKGDARANAKWVCGTTSRSNGALLISSGRRVCRVSQLAQTKLRYFTLEAFRHRKQLRMAESAEVGEEFQ
jgi:hypothetical protein